MSDGHDIDAENGHGVTTKSTGTVRVAEIPVQRLDEPSDDAPVEDLPVCEICAAPAIVHVRNEVGGVPVVRHRCLSCADADEDATVSRKSRLNVRAVLITMGVIIVLVSFFADSLGLGNATGFGWQQWGGLILGGIVLLVGALLGIPTLTVVGSGIAAITVLADQLGMGNAELFGWQQISGIAIGGTMVFLGALLHDLKPN